MTHRSHPAESAPAASQAVPAASHTQLSLSNPHDAALRPSPLPAAIQWAIIAVFVVTFLASGWFAVTEHWRRATFILGSSLLWLSATRLVCDSARVGVLAVRSQRFDAVFTAVVGGLMLFLSSSVDALGS